MNKPTVKIKTQQKINEFLAVKRNFRALVAGLIGVWLLAMVVLVLVFLNMNGMVELFSKQPEPTQLVLSLPTPLYTSIPPPDPSAVEAEVAFLGADTSSDRTELIVNVSIYNYNTTEFTLTENDVRLNLEDGDPAYALKSRPALPHTFKAGDTQDFVFTFQMPASKTPVFQIFTVEYDIEVGK